MTKNDGGLVDFYKISYFCKLMVKKLFFLTLVLFSMAACKTQLEKVRTSNNPELQLSEAYKYYEAEEYAKAKSLFELVVGSYIGRPESEKIYYTYAYTSFKLGQYVSSAYYFKRFSETFPNSDLREDSDFMIAYSHYQMSPSFRLEQASTKDAIEAFQLFANTHPDSKRLGEANDFIDELRRKLEKKAFYEGRLYYDLGNYQSATISFKNLLQDYPESPDAEEVRFLIAKSSYLFAENSIASKQEERYNTTVEDAERFIRKYKQSDFSKEINSIKKDAESKLKEIRNE